MEKNKINIAKKLRKNGLSLREISEKLNISKSTASLWLRDVKISSDGQKRIRCLITKGTSKGLAKLEKIRREEERLINKKAESVFKSFPKLNKDYSFPKIACSLLYWCEGGKLDESRVSFINSDPKMIEYFMKVFRESFEVAEEKFRVLVHLHDYHDPEKQIIFWSKITSIPPAQFNKSYLKKNTGKNRRKNYQGCISIRYYDSKIKKELTCIYKKLVEKTAGVG